MVKKMNKIEKLINDLCPDGVEVKTIGEVCQISRGRVMSKDYLATNAGDHPVYSSQTANNGVFGCIKTYDYDGEYVTWTTDGANAGSVFYRNGKFSITNVCGLLKPINSDLNTKFLSYILGSVAKAYVSAGMGNPKLMSNVMAKVKIPIPPLDVQEDIVKILDNFTMLEAELEAELEARRKQYEYYRNELLTFGKDVKSLPFENVITSLRTGLNPRKNFKLNPPNAKNYYITVRELDGFDISISDKTDRVDDEGLVLIQNRSRLQTGDILFSATGTIGRTALVKETPSDWNIKEGIYAITPNSNIVDVRFLIHLLHSKKVRSQILAQADGSTVSSIPMATLRKVSIPIPPITEQHRIATILDKFDALVNDISIGLPAELNARRKQYEYYRNQLLTFKPMEKQNVN
jgi:type I restriction enzyme S subunit